VAAAAASRFANGATIYILDFFCVLGLFLSWNLFQSDGDSNGKTFVEFSSCKFVLLFLFLF
jgi:hypothetical protein